MNLICNIYVVILESVKPSNKAKLDLTSTSQQTPLERPIVSKIDTSVPNNLKSFTFNDLKNATKNFRSESLIGEGGFGWVFKGWLDENNLSPSKPGSGIVVAVKRLKRESFQGHKEWLVCELWILTFLLAASL